MQEGREAPLSRRLELRLEDEDESSAWSWVGTERPFGMQDAHEHQ